MMEMNNKTDAPIGVFDSRVGGLTVNQRIILSAFQDRFSVSCGQNM